MNPIPYSMMFLTVLLSACLQQEDTQITLIKSLTKKGQSPVIQGDTAFFFYTGNAKNASIVGDFTGWQPKSMQKIIGSNIHYHTEVFQPEARLEYKLIIDNSWKTDPLNDDSCITDLGFNSEVKMPEYLEPEWIYEDEETPGGALYQFNLESKIFGKTRPVAVYLPSGFEKEAEYPVLIVHDGLDYVRRGRAQLQLDNLIHKQVIVPVVVLFVSPQERTREYRDDLKADYVRFIEEELLPYAVSQYNIKEKKDVRGVMGSSYGGHISLYSAVRYPDKYKYVAPFSPYVSIEVLESLRGSNSWKKIYLLHGTYDHLDKIHSSVASLNQLFQSMDNYTYVEEPEAHNYYFWRKHFAEVLKYFYGDC